MDDERELSVHQLRLLCAVIECGSFSRAARLLFITQPALTVQIRRLERSLGVRLTERNGRRTVPTAAGEAVYASAKGMLAHQQTIRATVAALRSGAERALTLGATHNSMHLLLPLLRSYRVTHPTQRLTVELETAQRLLGRVAEGSVDLGFAWDYTAYTGASWHPLGEDEFILVGGGVQPPAGPIEPAALAGLPFVAVQNGPAISYVEETLALRGIQLTLAMRAPSVDVAKQFVVAGLGVSILPLALVERELAAGELWRVRVAGLTLRRQYGYLLRRSGATAPGTMRFVEFLAGRRGTAVP